MTEVVEVHSKRLNFNKSTNTACQILIHYKYRSKWKSPCFVHALQVTYTGTLYVLVLIDVSLK